MFQKHLSKILMISETESALTGAPSSRFGFMRGCNRKKPDSEGVSGVGTLGSEVILNINTPFFKEGQGGIDKSAACILRRKSNFFNSKIPLNPPFSKGDLFLVFSPFTFGL
jgi:hypothetical protein